MSAFRAAVESGELDAIVASLADDVVLHSPVTFKPFEGKEAVTFLFSILVKTFEDFCYVGEFSDPDGQEVLRFRTHIGDRQVEGVDILRLDGDGKVIDITVMVRPLSAALALRDAVGAQLAGDAL